MSDRTDDFPGCGKCRTCLKDVKFGGMPFTSCFMIRCAKCGNKRCPKAENHIFACSNSNTLNQEPELEKKSNEENQ